MNCWYTLHRAKDAIPNDIPVGYVDAYYELIDRPAITEACDDPCQLLSFLGGL